MSANTFKSDRKSSITKEHMEQYEAIRQSGVCNMLDRQSVLKQAKIRGFLRLAELIQIDNLTGSRDYNNLIENYVFYMREFGLL